jgi:hypothetical protein
LMIVILPEIHCNGCKFTQFRPLLSSN